MIREGSEVEWKWGNGTAVGKVIKTSTETVRKIINRTEVVKHGEIGNKALLIKQGDGSEVLKLESEVSKI